MLKAIVLLACVLGALADPQDSEADYRTKLMMEFKDFIVAVPLPKVYTKLLEHLNGDKEMQAALEYVQEKDFRQHLHALTSRMSVKQLRLQYLEAGLDVERYAKMVPDILGGMEFTVPEGTKRSFGAFLADVDALMPYDKLAGILQQKLETSPVFIRFFEAITTPQMHALFDKTLKSKEFKHVAHELEDMDIAVYLIMDYVYQTFGWKKVAKPNEL